MSTLRQRLTWSHTLVALLAVALVALLANRLIVRSYDQFAQQRAWVARQAIAPLLARSYQNRGGWEAVGADLRERIEARPALAAQRLVIADERRRVVFDSRELLEGRLMPLRFRPQSTPIVVGGRTVGYLATPLDPADRSPEEQAFLRSISVIAVVGGVTSGLVALLVAWLVARRLTRPLRSLTEAARRLSRGERHTPIAPPRDAELAELAVAFNTMAAGLDHAEALRRQMIADIAHELRTPLSVLRLQIEGLEDGIEQPTPATFASLHQEVTLLARLVDDLRLLSLADAGQLSLDIQPLDPCEVIDRAAAAAAARARRQQIDLRAACAPGIPRVAADPQRLAQMLGNLIENALRYTPPGGRVNVRATPAADGRIQFEVADTGPGIAPEDLPRVFDRFFRADKAREREKGGSGLGLAIVQRLAEAHGGRATVTSQPGQGACFSIVLPVAVPQPASLAATR